MTTDPWALGTRCSADLVARGPAMGRLRNARLVDDFFVSGILQETALGVVTAPGWPRHLASLRRSLAERVAVAVEGLGKVPGVRLGLRPAGGFLLWVDLAEGSSATEVASAARAAGVAVPAGDGWFPAEPDAAYLRVSVASAGPADVAEGMRRLAVALRGVLGAPRGRRPRQT